MAKHTENYAAFYNELGKLLGHKNISKTELSRLKVVLCRKYKLKKIPTDMESMFNIKEKRPDKKKNIAKQLQTKPSRTESGVTVVAIMTSPHKCPHASSGPCIYCPGGINSAFGSVPQSYTGREPATMRGIRNNYDSYLQIFNRLEQYVCLGHDTQKVELIIMGGTFPSFPEKYKKEFVMFSFKALNDFGGYFFKKSKGRFVLDVEKFRKFFEMPGDVHDAARVKRIQKRVLELKNKNLSKGTKFFSLENEQLRNENAFVRCVGMTIETRPDYGMQEHGNEMLALGATRVELGIQSIHDDVLKKIKRGHTLKQSIESIRALKDLGFKLNFHMMPGLPGSNLQRDEQMFVELFMKPEFKPDMLKIYPCMVVEGTELYKEWKAGRFTPITTEQAAELIAKIKENVPEYCRIMRVQRDIPSTVISAGVDRTNLRQYIDKLLKSRDKKCRCIRCREPRFNDAKGNLNLNIKNIKIKVIPYEASNGFEFFISAEDRKKDVLLGFCRLRFPSQSLRKEITKDSALIRELHVYGSQQLIGSEKSKGAIQHHGLGRKLLAKAEEIARKNGKKKIIVISGIGARAYYKKFGYKKEGPYMTKKL